MRAPLALIVSQSYGRPLERIACTAGLPSMELRAQWFEDMPRDEAGMEWRCEPAVAEFVGEFEHRKSVVASDNCFIWVRYFDANGFWYDTPRVAILTHPND